MSGETSKPLKKRTAARSADPLIATCANAQHGLITTRQLLELGLSAGAVSKRAADGRLHRVHRGVYAVGHRTLTEHGRRLAALMTVGDSAVFSHRTAAALHGLLTLRAAAPLDVLTPGRPRPRTDGINVHTTRSIDPADRTVAHGLPVTGVARTLVDIAGAVNETTLRKAVHEAEVGRVLDVAAVERVLSAHRCRPGTALLRTILSAPVVSVETFISLFLALCDTYGVKHPAVDVWIDTGLPVLGQADLVYESERVIVELDGARTHLTRARFEEDRRRDSYLSARGWLTLRYTWRRLNHDAPAVADELKAVLARRAA